MTRIEQSFGEVASERGVAILRVVLGMVFVWFGVLKFCPGLGDVDTLAVKTMHLLTLSLVPAKMCIPILAFAETSIGVALIAGRWMRLVTVFLLLHLFGSFLPMVLFLSETWKHFPYAPTLAGQYILKNMVLIAAAVVVGAGAFAKARAPMIVPMKRRNVMPANLFVELNSAETSVVAMPNREWRRS